MSSITNFLLFGSLPPKVHTLLKLLLLLNSFITTETICVFKGIVGYRQRKFTAGLTLFLKAETIRIQFLSFE